MYILIGLQSIKNIKKEKKMEQPVRISEDKALEELGTFLNDKQSLVMATVDENAEPFVSYTPYVEDEAGSYYIYISGFVAHARNLQATKKASIMFIEDESKCGHIFGRKRLSFKVDAQKFEENDARNESINKLFTEKFGNKVHFLQKMPDFRIYKLTPKSGDFVLGFGSAYKVSGDRKTLSIKDAEHKEKHEKLV